MAPPMIWRKRSPSTSGRDIRCWLCYQSRCLWVPTDIWEHILGMFKDQLEVMAVCGRVCMAWRTIATRYTHKDLDLYKTLRSLAEVLRFSQLSRAGILHSMESVTFSGSISDGRTNRSLAHFAPFAAMLAGNVPRTLVGLKLEHGEWPAGIPRSIFLHLTAFTRITKLTLDHAAFPSISVFDRLVCALSRLKELRLSGVSFTDTQAPIPRDVFSHLAAPIAKLTLDDVAFPSIDAFGRLVCTLSCLKQLYLSGVSFSDAQAPTPLNVSLDLAAPTTALTLTGVAFPSIDVFDRFIRALLRLKHPQLPDAFFPNDRVPAPQTSLLDLAASITKLTLYDVALPSIDVFGRLVCALSHLDQLELSRVSFRDAEALNPRSVFSHLAAPITKLTLSHVKFPSIGIFDRLVCTLSHLEQLDLYRVSFRDASAPDPRSVFSHLAAPITKLTLGDVEFPSIGVFDRLVCALSHLEQLYLFGVSFRDAEAPDPRSVFSHLASPITNLTLGDVEFPSIGVLDRLVCTLSHLEQLDLFRVSFRDAEASDPRSIFSHLAAPITKLTLNHVEFSSIGVFDRLVCTLSHLEQLDLFRVSFRDAEALDPRSVFSHLAAPIAKLTLNHVEFSSIGVFDRLVCTLSHLEQLDLSSVAFRDAEAPDPRSVFSHLAAPITKLRLNHVELPSIGVFDRLVCALSHLEQLDLFRVSFRDASAPDPRSVFSHLAAPITKLRLNHVEFPSIGVFDRLVCALSRLEQLELSRVSFRDAQVPAPQSDLLDLAASITKLTLYDVAFPSIDVFGRLVCALSHLEQLELSRVSFRDAEALNPRSVFSHLAAPIAKLTLNHVKFPSIGHFDRLVCALSHLEQIDLYRVSFRDASAPDPRSVFSHLAAPITKLTLGDVEFPSIGVFDRLVCALSHLEQLHLNSVSFSDIQALAPLGRHWNTPPNLHQIRVDQSPWYSASQCGSHMFRALAANKTIACCRQLVLCLGRGSGILLDSVKDISLQQVLDCAGDSLQTLKLGLLFPSPNPGLDRVDIERLVDTCVNISHNTSLRSLEIRTSLRGLRTNPNHLIWIPRLISHASVASIEDISVQLSVDSQDNIDRQRFDRDFMGLLKSLHKCASLDDMLFAPDYTSLKEMAFCILLPPKCGCGSYKWTESLSEIFPKLAARRILRSDIREENEEW